MKKIWKCCLFVVSVFLLAVGAVASPRDSYCKQQCLRKRITDSVGGNRREEGSADI